jgi:uncharacterized membrane protein SpoIIM required for sporulation
VDQDAFASVHADQWDRLEQLTRRRRLTGAEADELLRLYQSASSHLSTLRSIAPETSVSATLSRRLARARTRLTGAPSNLREDVSRFFGADLPVAFYRIRWLTLAAGAAFTLIAVLYGWWAANNGDVLRALGGDERLQQLVQKDFVNYYSANPAASFAGQVWTNNAWIAAQCVALGVTGLYVPYQLYLNAQNVGLTGGIMFAYGKGDVFFSYILPHGLTELTAVFVAAAAGLRIFWAWVAPGALPRLESLAREGRALITVALGLALVLLASGLVEAFVTPSRLPVGIKLAIGAVLLACYWTYALVLGRRAYRAGYRGDLAEPDAGDRIAYS